MKLNDIFETDSNAVNVDEIIRICYEELELSPGTFSVDRYTGEVDTTYDVYIPRSWTFIKVKFGSIIGHSFFGSDSGITSLTNCPNDVDGGFTCHNTNITSLKDCPKAIGDWFSCENIKIIDPKEYRWALYSEITGEFSSDYDKIDHIINTYGGAANRKHWPEAINLLSKIEL